MAELERTFPILHFLPLMTEFALDRLNFCVVFNFTLFLCGRNYFQAVETINTYLLISNTLCTAMLWASYIGIAYFLANLTLLCRVDSRERLVLGLYDNFRWQIRFVHGGILHYYRCSSAHCANQKFVRSLRWIEPMNLWHRRHCIGSLIAYVSCNNFPI